MATQEQKQPLSNKSSISGFINVFSLRMLFIWFLNLLSAFGFSWFFRLSLKPGGGHYIWISLIFAFVFLVFFLLQIFVVAGEGNMALFAGAESLALGGIFLEENLYFLVIIFFAFLSLLFANISGRRILDNALKIKFRDVSRVVLPKAVLALALIISITVPFSLKSSSESFPFPASLFDGIYNSSQGALKAIFPEVDFLGSLADVAKQISQLNIDKIPEAKNLPPALKQQLVAKSVQEFYKSASDFAGKPIDPNLKFADLLYESAKDNFVALSENIKNLIFIAIAVLIFVVIEGVSLPIRWVATALAYLIYQVMLGLGYIRIGLEERSKEIIIMD